MSPRLAITVGIFLALAIAALDSLFIIDEREQAIVVRVGEPQRTITSPGLHFKIPVVEQVVRMERRILSLDIAPQNVLAADQRRIVADSFARYRINDPLATYQAARTEFQQRNLLENILGSTMREVLAQQSMESIVSGERLALMQRIGALTNERARSIGLEVIDVRLKRVDLPQQNSNAIFDRMRTERQQEAAQARAEGQQQKVEIQAAADRQQAEILAEAERTSQTLRGEADADAVKIFADAFGRDEDFFEFYRTMQAYRKALGKDDTTLVLSPDSDFFKLFIENKKK